MKAFAVIIVAALALAGQARPAAAQTAVQVAAFDSIELRGGGVVTIRHGPRQRVTLLRGNTQVTGFRVNRQGQLRIDACRTSCRDYDLRIEIVTPELDGAAIHGGGVIRAEGRFPDSGMLAIAITGGGAIDLTPIESGSVAASISGGGSIRTHARNSLLASINGGGSIGYRGDPSVTSAVNGGGAVSRIR